MELSDALRAIHSARLKKRFAIAGGLLIATVFGVAFICAMWKESEPQYNGKKLSYWLKGFRTKSLPPRERGQFHDAIMEIGTNAIPTLLRMLGETDEGIKNRVLSFVSKHQLVKVQYRPAIEMHFDVLPAFSILGTNAASAVPELIGLYENASSGDSKICPAIALRTMREHAQSAVPMLIKDFNHTNFQVRLQAVTAVMEIRGKPELAIPALCSVLKDPRYEIRVNALAALNRYGADARSAAPEVLALYQRESAPGGYDLVREAADRALWGIVPDAPETRVVKGAPGFVKGIAVEGLFLELGGDWTTVISRGSRIATFREHRSTITGSRIRLYRAMDKAEKGTLLGEFEIVGVPPHPDVINARIRCTISGVDLLVCARDLQNNPLKLQPME